MNLDSCKKGTVYQEFQHKYGARVYAEEGKLHLVILYDDVLDEELRIFSQKPFEVVLKTFGLVSIFTFKFGGEWIIDAPFNQFQQKGKLGTGKTQIPIIIYICESNSGLLMEKRECFLTKEFSAQLTGLLEEHDHAYAEKYDLEEYNRGMRLVYDNHIIDELYKLTGDRQISCFVQ